MIQYQMCKDSQNAIITISLTTWSSKTAWFTAQYMKKPWKIFYRCAKC